MPVFRIVFLGLSKDLYDCAYTAGYLLVNVSLIIRANLINLIGNLSHL